MVKGRAKFWGDGEEHERKEPYNEDALKQFAGAVGWQQGTGNDPPESQAAFEAARAKWLASKRR